MRDVSTNLPPILFLVLTGPLPRPVDSTALSAVHQNSQHSVQSPVLKKPRGKERSLTSRGLLPGSLRRVSATVRALGRRRVARASPGRLRARSVGDPEPLHPSGSQSAAQSRPATSLLHWVLRPCARPGSHAASGGGGSGSVVGG